MDYHNLNLSSKPFYNLKTLLLILFVLYTFSIFLSIFTAKKIYNNFKLSEDSKIKIASLKENLKKERKENSNLKMRLNSIDKKMTVEQAKEINSLVLERIFSWSKLLESLEKTLPEEVRLLSLSTSTTGKSSLNIRLSALSTKRDGMLQTIEALKASGDFKNIKPIQFQDEEKSSTLGKKFELQFVYLQENKLEKKERVINEEL